MSDHAAVEAPASDAPKSSILPKILVSGFIASVIVVETVLFFLFVPSADDVAALAEANLIKKVQAHMEEEGEPTVEDENKAVEFPLGDHSATFTPPGADRTYRVEFRLFGTVKAKDLEHVEGLYMEREGRFRHRLMLEIRNATMDELNENQLGLIQRRILATSNEILEEPILLGVGFQDYQVIEE
ncbi:MAG: dihydrolipoamide acetyltransferase [Pirellulaceae bacterium]|nr:dihydrolipoamide acetyltransferase [Pirellulaceae bacterium]